MAVENAVIVLAAGAAPVALNDAEGGIGPGMRIYVNNAGANTVHIGDADVTVNSGYPLAAGAAREFVIGPNDVLFARAAEVGGTELRVLRTSVGATE